MWSYHNLLEQVPKSQMLVLKELKWGTTRRFHSTHCSWQAIKTPMHNLSEVISTYSHCAVLCLQSTAQHSTGCWYTYTAKQLILIVHIHLWVLNVGQVLSRHWNSDPTSRNPFRNFNLKCEKQSYFEHCITNSTNKHFGDKLIAYVIYTSWIFEDKSIHISGTLGGTKVLEFHLYSEVHKYAHLNHRPPAVGKLNHSGI